MPKIDLLPCPFCGKLETLKMLDIQDSVYHVICDAVIGGCGASTGWNYTTPEKAAEEWNTRAFESNQIPGAKWMQVGTDIYECSHCNARLYGATVERLVDTEHFCYSCGSKMEVQHDKN